MSICGPNCFGLISVKTGFAAYSGPLSRPLRAGPVAIVSQSGGLGANVFVPRLEGTPCYDVHFDTQEILEVLEQADVIKEGCTRLEIHEQIQIAIWVSLTPSD